jgi:NADH-quinone oxidoreductase subunit N
VLAAEEPHDPLRAGHLARLHGLAWRRPGLAATLLVALVSLAGIPLTGGFVAKVLVLGAGVAAERWALVLTLVVGSAIGLVAYLRPVVAMLRPATNPATAAQGPPAVPRRLAGLDPRSP